MEYCGGGAVSDLYEILDRPLSEDQIAYICRETLQVSFLSLFVFNIMIFVKLRISVQRD